MKDWCHTFAEGLWLKPDDIGAEEAAFIKKALRLRRGQSVLEAPCGAGRIAIHLAHAGCNVTGIDLRRSFTNRAAARCPVGRHAGDPAGHGCANETGSGKPTSGCRRRGQAERLSRNVGPEMMTIQPEFLDAVRAVDEACAERFRNRLVGSYVAGSVARQEALPGISDLDWWTFLHDEATPSDRAWRRRMERRLVHRDGVFPEAHVNVHSLSRLAQESFWRFILRYNCLRWRGANVVALLERRGCGTPGPSRKLAKSRLGFVRDCLSAALRGDCPATLPALPSNPYLATRKLARSFMVVETAFLLMSRGTFRSFGQQDVLVGLASITPKWNRLIAQSGRILNEPLRASVKPSEFMREAGPYVTWVIQQIEAS